MADYSFEKNNWDEYANVYEPVDIFVYYKDLKKAYSNISNRDIIISMINFSYLLPCSESKIIERIVRSRDRVLEYIENRDGTTKSYFRMGDGYYFPLEIQSEKTRYSRLPSDLRKKECSIVWDNPDSRVAGKCIISFVRCYNNYKTTFDAILEIARIIGVDFEKARVRQLSTLPGLEFVPYIRLSPNRRPLKEIGPARGMGEVLRLFKTCRFDEGDIACGTVCRIYEVFEEALVIFLTYQRNIHTGEMALRFLEPNAEHLLLNKRKLLSRASKRVFIFDDLLLVDKLSSDHDVTWSGDVDICQRVDWSTLQDKNLCYCFNPNNAESVSIAVYLQSYFRDLGKKIEFSCYSLSALEIKGFPRLENVHKDSLFRMANNSEVLPANLWFGRKSIEANVLAWSSETGSYVIDDLIKVGDRVLVYGKGRIGKSFFALDVAMSAVDGKGLRNRSNEGGDYSVLYVDANSSQNRFAWRCRRMVSSYKGGKNNDFSYWLLNYLNLHGDKWLINLNLPQHRDNILREIYNKSPELVIFDNILSLFSKENNINIFDYFNLLMEEVIRGFPNITIVVVDDIENYNFRSMPKKTEELFDTFIELVRPKNCPIEKTTLQVSVPQANWLSGKQRLPFFVTYCDEGEFIRRLSRPCDSSFKQLSSKQQSMVEAARSHDFLTVKILREEKVITGMSESAVTVNLKKLCDEGWLYKIGEKSNTKYFAV